MRTRTTIRGGVKETRPDFWVVRVSLLGMTQTMLGRMMETISNFPKVKAYKSTGRVAMSRLIAQGPGSMQKRYVNVASGSSDEPELDAIAAELKRHGFEASKAPGPLLLSTTGGQWPKLTPMPMSTGRLSSRPRSCWWRRPSSQGQTCQTPTPTWTQRTDGSQSGPPIR